MMPQLPPRSRLRRPIGFTLVELLVVLTIVVLVSAVTLPTVLPALNHRQVGEAARILQAALAGARDAAIRDNAPRGIRLLPDPVFNGSTTTLAYNRFVPLETAADYTSGRISITFPQNQNPTTYFESPLLADQSLYAPVLRVDEAVYVDVNAPSPIPNERTSWFWNIRIGDKIRLNDSGHYYTVVGPALINPRNPNTLNQNPELFVNDGSIPPATKYIRTLPSSGTQYYSEYLYVVNGIDDNGDGFVDSGWDGFNNNYNYFPNNQPIVDEWAEWETEAWTGTELTTLLLNSGAIQNKPYTITRRPTPAPGSRVVTLPGGVVIDATSWNSSKGAERSRLPVDPKTFYVDILVNSNGQVVPTTEYSSPTGATSLPFFHFWLTEREDVHELSDLWGLTTGTSPTPVSNPNNGSSFMLPLPASYYASLPTKKPAVALEGERTLLTLFTRTGQITSNSIENFSISDINAPFYQAQTGAREAQ